VRCQVASKVIMVEATSIVCTVMEHTQNVDQAMSMCTCVVPFSRLWWSLGFGDENTRIDLWLDTSSSAHVRRSLLEGLSYELCTFHLFQSFTLWLVVSDWSQVRLVVSRSQCLEVSGIRVVFGRFFFWLCSASLFGFS
jgi:hypothetical protein